MNTATITIPDLREVEHFLFREAELLDMKRWEDWADLFTADGTYWVPTAEDQADPYTRASIMFDDRQMMANRIRRLRHPEIHAQTPPSRTVHMVSNVTVSPRPDADGCIAVGCCFLMLEYRVESQLTYGGRFRYQLAGTGGDLKIRSKTVQLVNCDAAHHLMAIWF